MCGRYTIAVTLEELLMHYLIEDSSIPNYKANYNVAPIQMVPAIVHTGEHNKLGELRWGLVPSWAKDDKSAARMINARAETVAEKPAFKRLLSSRRCIIPADGFYEWRREGSAKQPMRIVMRDGGLLSLAGLYDIWAAPDGSKLGTCTIITTEPNSLMADIHDRMPAILRPEEEAEWIDRGNHDVPSLLRLLKPYDADKMRAYPVSPRVGNVRNNDEELLREA